MAGALRAERAINSLETLLKNGQRYSSPTMGAVERANQDVIGIIRTLQLPTERSLEVNLTLNGAFLPWLARQVRRICTRFAVPANGTTPNRSLAGRDVR